MDVCSTNSSSDHILSEKHAVMAGVMRRPTPRYRRFVSHYKRRKIIHVPNTERDTGRHCLIFSDSKAMNKPREHDYN
jgi:hypothetical protein